MKFQTESCYQFKAPWNKVEYSTSSELFNAINVVYYIYNLMWCDFIQVINEIEL